MSELSLEYLQDRLSAAAEAAIPEIDVDFRPMFGGVCAYVDGRVFASLSNIGLALKLAPTVQADLLAESGAKRLRYEPDAPESKQYIVVPDPVLGDTDRLWPWVKLSIDFVKSLPAPKTRAAKSAS